jgi:hypothetical protein
MAAFDVTERLARGLNRVDGEGYLTAQVCLNGHSVNSGVECSPEFSAKFCAICGAATICTCPGCDVAIRGAFFGSLTTREYEPPNHCHNCGEAFPWTKAKLAAAKEHALEIEGLEQSERVQLQNTFDDLAAGGPRTELAASRFKRLMKKGGQGVGSGLYKVAIDLASEATKKALLG